jgi:hypothetical protein
LTPLFPHVLSTATATVAVPEPNGLASGGILDAAAIAWRQLRNFRR